MRFCELDSVFAVGAEAPEAETAGTAAIAAVALKARAMARRDLRMGETPKKEQRERGGLFGPLPVKRSKPAIG